MKHRFLKIALASVMLAGGVGTATTINTQSVQATQWYIHHSPYFVTHKVRLIKNITLEKFKFGKHTYQDSIVAIKHLKKGSIVKVKKGGATYPWFVTGHGMKCTSHYAWTVLHQKNWFKVIK
ncbi:hypothetical protein [Lactobacillus crispatus]|uniref:hypothetical protein n=1 Tax=Lactobacillus crispatus TaxID=47770 RepID=UPI0015DF9C9F|nr:hypothetical protein [Lactobacillus crispatus]QLK33399.1 hypothetical protein H0G71_04145 [Lactobacillus crispatus]